MKFPYLKQPNLLKPQAPWIARPIIPVKLSYERNSLNVAALIDSGADFCIFNTEIGERLGIPIKEGETLDFFGITKIPVKVYLHKIKLQVLGIDHLIEISAGFTEASGVVAILGQEGFFDNFRIKFEKDHNVIEITPVKKKK